MVRADAANAEQGSEPAASPPAARKVDTLAEVQARLRDCHYPALQRVTCELYEGVLVLRGRVPSFYQKQLAQAVAARCAGVEEVVNKLEVMLSD